MHEEIHLATISNQMREKNLFLYSKIVYGMTQVMRLNKLNLHAQ
jgi:hypothetical protein